MDVKGSTLEEGPEVGMLNRILGEEVLDKTGNTGNWRKYENVERDTSKPTIVDGEIGRRAKTHIRDEVLLATRRL